MRLFFYALVMAEQHRYMGLKYPTAGKTIITWSIMWADHDELFLSELLQSQKGVMNTLHSDSRIYLLLMCT